MKIVVRRVGSEGEYGKKKKILIVGEERPLNSYKEVGIGVKSEGSQREENETIKKITYKTST